MFQNNILSMSINKLLVIETTHGIVTEGQWSTLLSRGMRTL